jgi:hypothetical protein
MIRVRVRFSVRLRYRDKIWVRVRVIDSFRGRLRAREGASNRSMAASRVGFLFGLGMD